jgi:hypothetical protein
MAIVWSTGSTPAINGPNLNQWGQEITAAATPTYVNGTAIAVSYDSVNRIVTINCTYAETIETKAPGSIVVVFKDPVTGFWPSGWDAAGQPIYTGGSASAGVRPTARTDIVIDWDGPDPSPAEVSSGTGGAHPRDRRSISNA